MRKAVSHLRCEILSDGEAELGAGDEMRCKYLSFAASRLMINW